MLVKLVLSVGRWQAFRSGRTWGSERSFPLDGPFLLKPRAPSGAMLGKGERAFSLPPRLCSVKDPEIRFPQQAWFLAVYFWKAAPATSPHRGALGGFPKAGEANGARRRGVSAALPFGLTGVNLDTCGRWALHPIQADVCLAGKYIVWFV